MKIKTTGPEHMSPAEFQALRQKKVDRKNKFGNKKIQTDDGAFDSQAEYARWLELKFIRQAGCIAHLERQKPFQLSTCKYYSDFYYFDIAKQAWVVEDVKGVRTDVYKLKKKMMKAELGLEIIEIRPKLLKRPRRWKRI